MDIQKFKNATFVVAHPDDEVLGCGGLIHRLKREGIYVNLLYLNNGNDFRGEKDVLKTQRQIVQVTRSFGNISKMKILEFDAIKFDLHGVKIIADSIAEFLYFTNSKTVFIHDGGDLNIDHKIAHEASLVACRKTVDNIISFPVPSSSELNPEWVFRPNLYIELHGSDLNRKSESMEIYKEEFEAMSRNRNAGALSAWARFYGLQTNGYHYAEPYKIIKSQIELF